MRSGPFATVGGWLAPGLEPRCTAGIEVRKKCVAITDMIYRPRAVAPRHARERPWSLGRRRVLATESGQL